MEEEDKTPHSARKSIKYKQVNDQPTLTQCWRNVEPQQAVVVTVTPAKTERAPPDQSTLTQCWKTTGDVEVEVLDKADEKKGKEAEVINVDETSSPTANQEQEAVKPPPPSSAYDLVFLPEPKASFIKSNSPPQKAESGIRILDIDAMLKDDEEQGLEPYYDPDTLDQIVSFRMINPGTVEMTIRQKLEDYVVESYLRCEYFFVHLFSYLFHKNNLLPNQIHSST